MKRPKWLPKWMPFSKETIWGCEGRGDGDSPYLVRYTLLKFASWELNLHHFLRSDADEHHDHPWDFITIPLTGCYYDETPVGRSVVWLWWPHFRRAEHRHRVQLMQEFSEQELLAFGLKQVEITVWTLMIRFKRRREWGFFTKNGWLDWRSYFVHNQC